MAENFYELPENLPVPINDGACAHLPGMQVPSICLPSTTGQDICLAKLQQRVVVYCYPLTGKPGHKLPQGWRCIIEGGIQRFFNGMPTMQRYTYS